MGQIHILYYGGSTPPTGTLVNWFMKVIFLDCDGVLNYTKWYTSEAYQALTNTEELDIDPDVIERLNRLSVETGSYFVISSSWKISSGCYFRLSRAGLKNVIDKTPDLIWNANLRGFKYSRGEEIAMWLNAHADVTDYIIIDDCCNFNEDQISHAVIVDPMYGFTEDDYTKAYTMLKSL